MSEMANGEGTVVLRLEPLVEALAPLIDAIADAVVRKMEERRKLDRLAAAVMQRMEELSGDDPAGGPAGSGSAGEGGEVSREEMYAMIVAALNETEPAAELP